MWVAGRHADTLASITPLVECYRDHLAELLRFFGARRIERGILRARRLHVNDTRRILKVCRETDDEEILIGAAGVLVNARFGRVAPPELVLKILLAAPSSQFVDRVFRAGRTGDSGGEDAQRSLAQNVARSILDEPFGYPFWTTNRAIAFLAETES